MDAGQGGHCGFDDGRERYEQLVRRANVVANNDKLFEQTKKNIRHSSKEYISGIDEQFNSVFFMAAIIRADKGNSNMLNYIFEIDEYTT